ncbi:Lipase, GDSL [Corchorus capsularis]|uniref:(+)-delta-cadinene synthase n=1 Tax=Corchorus capsularis TaxID=210143 RepID=A0A1R3H8Z5_COCAP|nr:Lipase, GDSL [Corchorus capsularis]
MSSQSYAIPTSTPKTMSKEKRPLANFVPEHWGDVFLSCPSELNMDATTQVHYEELKQEVGRMLAKAKDIQTSQKLHLIDVVQRLGVAYYFQKEIEDTLETIYCDFKDDKNHDLHTTALQFRLLREHGFKVDCESFNKFKDEKGNFKASLISDVRGLLELYEAAHLQFHGEDILDEALDFATFHLKSAAETMVEYPDLSAEITNALKRPIRKSLPRLVTRSFIPIYEAYGTKDENLLKLAKLDFMFVQHLHRKELSELTRWWKRIDIPKNFPFIRDRLVECYLWMMGAYFEPHYSFARIFVIKVMVLTSAVDDIYDAYGTYEEHLMFRNAIHRWDISCIDQLPANYMKVLYREILNVYEEMEGLLNEQGKSYRIKYAREVMKKIVEAYYTEAKWLHENYTPTLEEYMPVSLVSCGYYLLAIISFVGMQDSSITEETFVWSFDDPKIIRASAVICRFMSDITTHKFERLREHIPSAIEIYRKQYEATEQEAYDYLNKKVKEAWQDINQEFLKPTVVPESILTRVLNLARALMLSEVYGAKEHQHRHGSKNKISLLVFGDSYVDTGNWRKNDGSSWKEPYGSTYPGKPSGRFSDGRVLTDYIASHLGIGSPIPYQSWKSVKRSYLRNGMNFGYGGTGVFDTLDKEPNMTTQIDFFQRLVEEKVFTEQQLNSSIALVSLAGNDYAAFLARNGRDIQKLTAFMKTIINQLAINLKRIRGLGVKRIAVTAIEPMGCLPQETAISSYRNCNEVWNSFSKSHNQVLEQTLQKLNDHERIFITLDLYNAFMSALKGKHAGMHS